MISIIKPPFVARLLGCRWTRLALDTDGLHISLKDAPGRFIRWADLATGDLLEYGALFHCLALPALQESPNAVSGKPATAGHRDNRNKLTDSLEHIGWLARWERGFWKAFAQQLHQQHRPQFEQQLRLIEADVKSAYPRSSVWLQLRQRAAETVTGSEVSLLRRPAHPDLLYARLKRIASGDEQLLQRYRAHYLKAQQAQYQSLFERIESQPLTPQQQLACITSDDSNLVLAGAGCGKTSTLIGRAAYLIASKQAEPGQILLLAFGRQAASEMQQRLQKRLGINLVATTFHALGQRIIAAVEGAQPRISPLAQNDAVFDNWVAQQFDTLLETATYRHAVLTYLLQFLHPSSSSFDFSSAADYRAYLAANDVRTLQHEQMHSIEACRIADWLWAMGIEYQYRPTNVYAVNAPGLEGDRQHACPDFYLPQYAICIDHILLDHNGSTAPYIDAAHYQRELQWLRHPRTAPGHSRLETCQHEQSGGIMLSNLSRQLAAQGVVLKPLSDEQHLGALRERGIIVAFSRLLAQLLRRDRAAWLDDARRQALISRSDEPDRLAAALKLLRPLRERYQTELAARGEIDFDDMIGRALEYVEQGQFQPDWQHILVDEFQDISEPRARLVRALREALPGATLFGVGDDWQSIYRFTGSDLSLTTHFSDFFGATTITTLDRTFRFNNSINEIASTFVMQNPHQLPKQLDSTHCVEQPAISLHCYQGRDPVNDPAALLAVLDAIARRAGSGATVLLLARHRFSLPDARQLARLRERYAALVLDVRTLHAAKGQEADFAVIMGLETGKYGFPGARQMHPLLNALLPVAEPFPHAEERRLFYVALTRARTRVYLLYPRGNPSIFVMELITLDYPVECNEFSSNGA